MLAPYITLRNALSEQMRENPLTRRYIRKSRDLYPQADGVIAISDGVARDAEGVLGLPEGHVQTIYNAIDIAETRKLSEEPLSLPDGVMKGDVLLGAGRLIERKNFVLLLRAFSHILETRNATLVIVGDGPERDNLVRLAEDLGIQQRVVFTGELANPFPYFKAADLFVNVSRYEGFCRTILEALACGTPVVSTDCPWGPAEILENGKYGALVPMDDQDALIQAINTQLDSNSETVLLRARAEEFDVTRMCEAYLDIVKTRARERRA